MKEYAKCVVMVSFLFASCIVFGSSRIGPDLSPEQQKIVDQYRLDFKKANRWPEQQEVPEFFQQFDETYTQFCLNRALREYEEHGRWFYCKDRNDFGNESRRCDEVVTTIVYSQLLAHFGSLEKLPNYSKGNHEKAIKFWQSWQSPDGSFHNVLDEDAKLNYKYVPNVLRSLRAKPLYDSFPSTTRDGESRINVKAILEECTTFPGLIHGASAISTLFTKIHEGETEYIPVVERGIEIFLSRLNSETGLFHENTMPTEKQWSNYDYTANHFKCIARLVGYSGAENFPFRHKLTDTAIAKQRYFQAGTVPVLRNSGEIYMLCLEQSAYRRKELLEAFAGNAKALEQHEVGRSIYTGSYTVTAIRMFGCFLNWVGYDDKLPKQTHYNGIGNSYRIVIGPFGRCANIMKKAPNEMPWHKDWSIEKDGLQARNAEYEKRRVVDIVPVCRKDDWKSCKSAEGKLILTRTFNLENANLENPYLKIHWTGGDIEIYVNGVFVKKKLAGLNEPKDPKLNKFGAIYISQKARETLKEGENTVTIKSSPNVDAAPQIRVGLIDWAMPKK